jgi:hypothetical protein
MLRISLFAERISTRSVCVTGVLELDSSESGGLSEELGFSGFSSTTMLMIRPSMVDLGVRTTTLSPLRLDNKFR